MQKTNNFPFQKINIIFSWTFFVMSILPLIALAYLGIFTRYLADDYSTAGVVSDLGFWKAQVFWYKAWTGRFSYNFLVSFIELFGVRVTSGLPIISLAAWCASLYWALKNILKALELQVSNIWIGFLADVIIFSAIRSFPASSQVIYWQTGILTYQVIMISIALIISLFIKRFYQSEDHSLTYWEYATWFLTFLIVGGFSETWAIMQVTITGLAFLIYGFAIKIPVRKFMMRTLFLGFCASWAALLIILKSPGNVHRSPIMANISYQALFNAVLSAFWDTPRYLSEWLIGNTALVLLIFLAGVTVGFYISKANKVKNLLWLGLVLLSSSYILIWAAFIPYYAVFEIRPVDRVVILPMFLFIWSFALMGVFIGITFQHKFSLTTTSLARICCSTFLSFALLWIPVRASIPLFAMAPSMRLYSQLWDQRDQYLRKASIKGDEDVFVDSLRRNPALHDIQTTFWIEGDLQDDPKNWINEAAAQYYRLKSITLRRGK